MLDVGANFGYYSLMASSLGCRWDWRIVGRLLLLPLGRGRGGRAGGKAVGNAHAHVWACARVGVGPCVTSEAHETGTGAARPVLELLTPPASCWHTHRVMAWEPVPNFAAFAQYGLLVNGLTHLVEVWRARGGGRAWPLPWKGGSARVFWGGASR